VQPIHPANLSAVQRSVVDHEVVDAAEELLCIDTAVQRLVRTDHHVRGGSEVAWN